MAAFTLPKSTDPSLPSIGGLGGVLVYDDQNNATIGNSLWIKKLVGSSNLWVPVSDAYPIPTKPVGGMATPVTGVVTVTATAAEIFAGASRKAGRRKMLIRNEDGAIRIRVGASSITQQNGFPIEPGAVLELDFDPNTDVPIYAISEGASVLAAVMEW